jgi:hypothetical protein
LSVIHSSSLTPVPSGLARTTCLADLVRPPAVPSTERREGHLKKRCWPAASESAGTSTASALQKHDATTYADKRQCTGNDVVGTGAELVVPMVPVGLDEAGSVGMGQPVKLQPVRTPRPLPNAPPAAAVRDDVQVTVAPSPSLLTGSRTMLGKLAPVPVELGSEGRVEVVPVPVVLPRRRHPASGGQPCRFCPYIATCRVNLERHERTHTGERPFPCPLCSHRSARADDLVKHIRCHTGDKPFKCRTCSYASVDSSNLLRHVHLHGHEGMISITASGSKVQRQSPGPPSSRRSASILPVPVPVAVPVPVPVARGQPRTQVRVVGADQQRLSESGPGPQAVTGSASGTTI